MRQSGKALPRIYSGTFLKKTLHMEEWLKGEYSRQRKECAQRPCHVKEASCPENRKFYEADVLGKGREQKLEGCSKCGFWKSLGRLYLVEDSGLILYSRENKEGFYFGSKGYPLEEKGVCLQRGTVDTGNRGDFLYNNTD